MGATVRELAELVGGQVIGDAATVISSAQPITDAGPGDITFAEGPRNAQKLFGCRASAAIVPEDMPSNGIAFIVVANPLRAFTTVLTHLRGIRQQRPTGIHEKSWISPSARLGADATVYPGVFVADDVTIGDRTVLYPGVYVGHGSRLGDDVVLWPNVVLYPGTIVGHRVMIHASSAIGGDGFGYRLEGGRHVKAAQAGHVEIGDDVEVGACTTIDRGTFGATKIGAGTKIDNLVQIAHNCRIGRHNLLVGQVGIAGSVETGDYVVAAGQVGIRDHVKIGDRAIIGAQSGVSKDVPAGERIIGAPARPEREQKRVVMSLLKLPEMRRQLNQLEAGLEELRAHLGNGSQGR
jgi:UDP-3-O-[3-hydroxymyristoyl] glucosamine N-acyltransferase